MVGFVTTGAGAPQTVSRMPRGSDRNLFLNAGSEPYDAEFASGQMKLFVFSEIYLSHEKFVKPLNRNVHVGSPLFDAIKTLSIQLSGIEEGRKYGCPGRIVV